MSGKTDELKRTLKHFVYLPKETGKESIDKMFETVISLAKEFNSTAAFNSRFNVDDFIGALLETKILKGSVIQNSLEDCFDMAVGCINRMCV